MPSIQLTFWSVFWLAVLAALIALSFINGMASAAAERVRRWSGACFDLAARVGKGIVSLWSLDGEKEEQAKRNARRIEDEISQRSKASGNRPLNDAEIKAITDKYGEAKAPTIGVITNHWVRRFVYVILAFVCAGADYVLVSSRAPILFGGGTPPPFLRTLFQYLQVITGVLFVSVAALSGMLIEETHAASPTRSGSSLTFR